MITIPNRPTPKCCAECPCAHLDGAKYCQAATQFNKITMPYGRPPKWCPIRRDDK